MIQLADHEVKELQDYLLEIPGKYGISVINFINRKLAEQKAIEEAQAQAETQEVDPNELEVEATSGKDDSPIKE